MPRLLVVHHTPSPALQEMFEAAVRGARTDEIDDVEVIIRPALTAAALDVLEADGILLGTPANIGYMSGALKHFFDGIYYPCLEATRRRPYGLYVHGGMDTTGAVRAVDRELDEGADVPVEPLDASEIDVRESLGGKLPRFDPMRQLRYRRERDRIVRRRERRIIRRSACSGPRRPAPSRGSPPT